MSHEPLSVAEGAALRRIGDRLRDERSSLAAEWNRRLRDQLPEIARDERAVQVLAPFNECLLDVLLRHARGENLPALYAAYHDRTRELFDSMHRQGDGRRVTADRLQIVARVGLGVVAERLTAQHDGEILAYVKIANQLVLLLAHACSDHAGSAAAMDPAQRPEDFLAILSHELRNPLAPIQQAVQALKLLDRGDAQMQSVETILDRQVRHLGRLLDDLLDVSRIAGGLLELHTETLSAGSIAARAVDSVQERLYGRHVALSFEPMHQPAWVEGDGRRLAQALGNLLDNAILRSEEKGRVWLQGRVEGEEVVFRVRDRGDAIPAPVLAHVFDLFTETDHSAMRRSNGLGVALPLARMLAELHRARVEAHSDASGAEFVLRLPAAPPPPTATAESPALPPALPPAAQKHRVLVLDDNVDAAESLGILLALGGHAVHIAHDGQSAIAAARAHRPDVVLLDIGLPGMDGYAVARELRHLDGMGNALLVAVTGFDQDADRERSQAAGIDHHLVKPIDPLELQMLLSRLPEPRRT